MAAPDYDAAKRAAVTKRGIYNRQDLSLTVTLTNRVGPLSPGLYRVEFESATEKRIFYKQGDSTVVTNLSTSPIINLLNGGAVVDNWRAIEIWVTGDDDNYISAAMAANTGSMRVVRVG